MQSSTIVRSLVATGAAAALLLVGACGGGGAGTTGPASGTISSKTVRVTGAISGFGSVIVNGVHYESGSAVVTLDGKPGTVTQLKVGEVVHITAKTGTDGVSHAETIDQDRLDQGPVQAVDTTAGTLTILGQVITVTSDTSFDSSIPGGTLGGIAVGDVIEVYGFIGTAGDSVATRISKADPGDNTLEVTGAVGGLDTAAMHFSIGTQAVDYSQAQLHGFPAAGPADGDVVEARGTTLLADGTLQATDVTRKDDGLDGHDGDAGEIEGLVTALNLPTDFEVAGQKVLITATTTFVGGSATDLALNQRVEVEGSLDASGALVADKVVLRQASTLEVSAPVEAVDAGTDTLQMLGATFVVNASTRVEDDEMHDQMFNLADVNVGDWLAVSGYPDPSGSGNIVVTRLERHAQQDSVAVVGYADNLQSPNFDIAGFTIATTTATSFWNEWNSITATDFFSLAAGKRVAVMGTLTSAKLIDATSVRIEQQNEDH